MLFSVVIPTHNRIHKLEKLLDSLNQQELSPSEFEVLVIATEGDKAFELLEKRQTWNFKFEMTHIPNDPYQGKSPSEKRNYGAKRAQNPWIAFVDDDCIALPGWLSQAKALIENSSSVCIEGHTRIPKPKRETLTYKGIKRLSRPKGYQTCNMFYKKQPFLELGGFDPAFPFYMEDTDLAWSVIEKHGEIEYCPDAIVEHPVPEPEPRRLLASALRMGQIPYLYKKHPETFIASKMRVFPRSYFIFVLFDLGLMTFLLIKQWPLALILFLSRLFLTGLYLIRLYRHCDTEFSEVSAVFYYTLICPLVGLFQLTRGNIKQRTFLFYT